MKDINQIEKKDITSVPLSAISSIIYRHYAIYINPELKEYNLSTGQYPFLIRIHERDNSEGITQSELANLFKMNEGTVARAIQKLESEKLIERQIDSKNRRRNIITITEKGKEVTAHIKNLEKTWENKIFNKELNTEEIIDLKWTLHNIAVNCINISHEKK